MGAGLYCRRIYFCRQVGCQSGICDGTCEELKVIRNGRLLKNKLVVLVNEGSASAAEIVSERYVITTAPNWWV